MTGRVDLTDEELMLRVQGGDPAAYKALFGRYDRAIYGYLRRRTGDPELASDVFQDTWLRVHRSANTFDAGSPFRPWLYRIALNAMRDSARKSKRQLSTTELKVEPGVNDPSVVDRLALEQAIGSLPETLHDAFLLGVVQGMDHNEVAQALDISPANARARISRARAQLRLILAPSGESE